MYIVIILAEIWNEYTILLSYNNGLYHQYIVFVKIYYFVLNLKNK